MQNPDYLPYRRGKRRLGLKLFSAFMVLALIGLALFQIPRINRALTWRMDIALTYARMLINPVSKLPTPAVNVQPGVALITPTPLPPTATPVPEPTPLYTPTPTLAPTPIPGRVQLTPPAYDEAKDKQDWNNCGPATLALYLRYYGWEGDQFDISDVIKPTRDDRNVNVAAQRIDCSVDVIPFVLFEPVGRPAERWDRHPQEAMPALARDVVKVIEHECVFG